MTREAMTKPKALLELADRLVDQSDEPWPNGTESQRLHYWRDKAITAAKQIRQALGGNQK